MNEGHFKSFNSIAEDPVYSCPVYIEIGCSHVDGYLCDMKSCNILKDYEEALDDD